MTTFYARCETCGGSGHLKNMSYCPDCQGWGKLPVPREYTIDRCPTCNTAMCVSMTLAGAVSKAFCPTCPPDREGRLIRAAGDVMRMQRLKGIAKYQSTLEDQNKYTIGGMIDMTAEELADGSVYVQKVREMYASLLDELEKAVDTISPRAGVENVQKLINRERGRG